MSASGAVRWTSTDDVPNESFRVGIVDYLNAWPLAWGFLTDRGPEGWVAEYHPPAEVARRLAEGRIDVGLVPSIEALRIPGATAVPGLCVASTREVRSVLLLSRGPLARIRRIALDRNSRTSAALVEILCREAWKIAPETVQSDPDPEAMLERADAALVIGDPALLVDRDRYQVVDLAAAWRDLTGHPFVFAVWAAAPGRDAAGFASGLERSLQLGLAELDAIVERAAAEFGLSTSVVRGYLTRNLSYRMSDAEAAGLAEFYRRAGRHGLA